MFDWIGAVPEGWEPIPDEVFAELGPLPADGLPEGLTAEYVDSLDRLVDEAAAQGPGPVGFGLLTVVDPQTLSGAARCQALAQLTGIAANLEAVRADYTAVVAGPAPKSLDRRKADSYVAHEVAIATRQSVYAADATIALARDLATVLQASRSAMRRGELAVAQAKVLHHATSILPTDVARAVEARVLPRAAVQSTQNFRRSVNRAVAALDPTWTERAKAARAEVEVSHTVLGDGVGYLAIRGPLEVTTGIHMALTAHAAKTKDEVGGTVAQRKLAGLRDWAEASLAAPDTPTHHGRLPTVNVTIDLLTLLGLRNHPAEIPGVGPIPADAACWLLADGAPLRRLIIDPMTGHLLDYGHKTYLVPPALADYLIAKNIHSAAPHSGVDARLCDMEHRIPHDQGGPTNPINTTPVERRWHRAKTHDDWTYVKHDNGIVIWTSPNGLTCQIDPYDYRTGP
jgi:hypothetical protein